MASVSFAVSQGGLHSHCVQHCIVQAGCNQADESRTSKNTLGFFPPSMLEKSCELLVRTNGEKHSDAFRRARAAEKCCRFFCFFLSIRARRSAGSRRCDAAPAVHALISLAVAPHLAFAICGKLIQLRIKRPFSGIAALTVPTSARLCFIYFIVPSRVWPAC